MSVSLYSHRERGRKMIIQSSNVSMASTRNYQRNTQKQVVTTRWQALNPANMSTVTQNYSSNYSEESSYNNCNDFADKMRNLSYHDIESDYDTSSTGGIQRQTNPVAALEECASKTLKTLLDMLYRAKGLTRHETGRTHYNYNTGYGFSVYNTSSISGSIGGTLWNQTTDTYFAIQESESTTFESTGCAITADGREINFDVSFTMSRSFAAEYASSEFMQYEQVLTDPLVIQLDSNPVSLSDQHFYFDLDCDGSKEEISSLGAGGAFLAYDKNNDGIINDGSELFGTKSGNGFFDLAQYDSDSNGWIDEADEIYDKLKVWYKDENGNDKLLNLKEADIGAIYLGSEKTQFSLNDKDNNVNGLMRRSGIFLRESGTSGTISQIDLARY